MRKRFQRAAETEAIIAYFKGLSLSEMVSFKQLSQVMGFHITSATPAYQSAKAIVLAQHGVVIDAVHGEGFVRLNGADMVATAARTMKSIRRKAKKGALVADSALRHNLTRLEHQRASEQLVRYAIIKSNAEHTPIKSNREQPQAPTPAQPFNTRQALKAEVLI